MIYEQLTFPSLAIKMIEAQLFVILTEQFYVDSSYNLYKIR